METMNMMELPINRIIEEIEMDLLDGNYDPMVILGKSGIGKTQAVRELAEKLGIGYKELRLVTMTETDIMGIPYKDENGTHYATNSILPREDRDGEVGIIAFDEITSASSTVRASAYQLFDSSRSIGDYKLPPKWKCIALGNGPDDGGVFSGMEHAMLGRGNCYRAETNVNTWKEWAVPNKVHPIVLAFLSMRPEYLHHFDPDGMASVFPSPRTWALLSKKLVSREQKKGGRLEPDDVEIYAAGAVGIGVATEFSVFYGYKDDKINIDDIITGKLPTLDLSKIKEETMYIVMESLISETAKRLETDANNTSNNRPTDKGIDMVCNVVNFALEIGTQTTDKGLQIIQELIYVSEPFRYVILFKKDSIIAERCPKFLDFCGKIANVLGQK